MRQYRIKINYQGDFSFSWGYALYSAFLAELDDDLSLLIHEDEIFNQYVTKNEWVINSESRLKFKDKYFLSKFDLWVNIEEISELEISEQSIADRFLINEPYCKNVRLFFLTPTTFKQDGEYVLFPNKDLIMQSLTNKWNKWAKHFVLEDIIWDNCKISRYNLRSINYYLKGAKIQGFIGYVDLYFWGSESMVRLGNMVAGFGQFSGIGIKTALGMGGIRFE